MARSVRRKRCVNGKRAWDGAEPPSWAKRGSSRRLHPPRLLLPRGERRCVRCMTQASRCTSAPAVRAWGSSVESRNDCCRKRKSCWGRCSASSGKLALPAARGHNSRKEKLCHRAKKHSSTPLSSGSPSTAGASSTHATRARPCLLIVPSSAYVAQARCSSRPWALCSFGRRRRG